MRTLRLVILHELKSTASKRSFWLMTLLFPVLITAISLGPQVLARRSVESELPRGVDCRGRQRVGDARICGRGGAHPAVAARSERRNVPPVCR